MESGISSGGSLSSNIFPIGSITLHRQHQHHETLLKSPRLGKVVPQQRKVPTTYRREGLLDLHHSLHFIAFLSELLVYRTRGSPDDGPILYGPVL